ncbi:ribonuclease H-like domain-containing protein [Tanacetum coccineum]
MSLEKDKCFVKDSSELKIFSKNDEVTSHKILFDDFQTDSQASSPNDDGREPSGSNIGPESKSDDTAKDESSNDDQGSVRIGEEDFSKGNAFENNDVPTNLFETGESNTLRRSSRRSKLPPKLNDYVLNSKSYEEVVLDKNWAQTINEEIEALLVGKGFNQRKGIEYERIFSLFVKMRNVRCLISLAVQKGWCLFQLDVNNAFLYGTLNEDALRQWNNRFSKDVVENDFKQSVHDHSLYTKESGGSFVSLLVYVDDIVLTSNDSNEINKVKTFLKSKFKIKDLGELKYFLGIEVLKTKKDGLCLSQRKYYLELLHDYGLLLCKPVSTPLHENIILAHKEPEDDKFLKNITSFQRLVGKLIYLTLTRPNISYSVHCLSQHMQAPLQSPMDLGLRVLKYLKGAPRSGVNYEKSEHMSLKVYANSDWAKCLVTRRSVSGYFVFFNALELAHGHAPFSKYPPMKVIAIIRVETKDGLLISITHSATTLQEWHIEPPVNHVIDRLENYFNKIKGELDTLDRTKDEDVKKFKSQKIHFDFSILIRIKELMVDVSSKCMEVALKQKAQVDALWKEKKFMS